MIIPDRVVERVLTRWEQDGDCWVSTYSVGSHGYAQVGWKDGSDRNATLHHRLMYQISHGEIPEDLTVDHICHVRKCVNPDHLRLLPNEVNASDNGQVFTNPLLDSSRSCPRGHVGKYRVTSFFSKHKNRHVSQIYCPDCKAEDKRRRRREAKNSDILNTQHTQRGTT